MPHARIPAGCVSRRPIPRRCRFAAAAGLALASVTLAACDGSDTASAAIEDARRTLTATHIAGTTARTDAFLEERYAEVVSALRPVTQAGSDRQRAAAQLLIGQAQGGQAELVASRAFALEKEAQHEASRLRSHFEHLVVGLRAQAAAATTTATTPDQQQIATQVRQVEAERAELSQQLSALRSEMDALRQQMSAAESAASEARTREAELRAQLLEASGERRTTLAVQAVEAQREAASHERDRALVDSRVSVLDPEAAQVQREIDSLSRRIELLNASRQRMQSLDQTLRERAAEDQRLATQSAETLVRELTALDAMRQSDIADAYQQAAGAYEQAIAATRQATTGAGDARQTAFIAQGSLHQSLGDVHAARARGQDRYASLLARLLESEPALPQASTIRQYFERVRADGAASRDAALAAYEEARSAYDRASARGELATRLDALKQSLARDQQEAAGEGAEPGAGG